MRALLAVPFVGILVLWGLARDPAGRTSRAPCSPLPIEKPEDAPSLEGRETAVEAKAAEQEPEPEAGASWRVYVRDGLDRPVRGVTVGTLNGEDKRTDALGAIELPPEPAKGTCAEQAFEVTGPETIVRLQGWIPVEAVMVDGHTGHRLEGGVVPKVSHVRRRSRAVFSVSVEPPGAYVKEPDRSWMSGFVSAYAQRVRVVVPVRREARLHVRVREPDGAAAPGARLVRAWMGGAKPVFEPAPDLDDDPPEEYVELEEPEKEPEELPESWNTGETFWKASGTADRAGWMAVRGVPDLLGERIRLVVWHRGRHAYGEAVLGRDDHADVWLPASCNRFPDANTVIGIGGGWGCGRRGRAWTRPGTSTIVICLKRRDGSPAAGAMVWLDHLSKEADADGHARFDRLPAGVHLVRVREPGFVAVDRKLSVHDGEARSVDVVEPEGWTAQVRVVDHEDRPVSFAKLEVDGLPVDYAPVEDGVQDLTWFTDARGGASIGRLPSGDVKLTARFGTRSAAVTLQEDTASGVIRLPPPK